MTGLPPRVPWPEDFPDVVIHTDVKTRDGHPDYAAAKSGDGAAALKLVEDLISPVGISRIVDLGESDVMLLPVVADETAGFNAIPGAMAQFVGS